MAVDCFVKSCFGWLLVGLIWYGESIPPRSIQSNTESLRWTVIWLVYILVQIPQVLGCSHSQIQMVSSDLVHQQTWFVFPSLNTGRLIWIFFGTRRHETAWKQCKIVSTYSLLGKNWPSFWVPTDLLKYLYNKITSNIQVYEPKHGRPACILMDHNV